MLIDGFTVLAQVLNFFVLVWLLKRYLYQPILDAIDAREQRIASELADAATKQQQAGQERDNFAQKNSEFDQQRDAMLQKASAEAETERQRLLAEARTAAAENANKHRLALARDQQQLQQELNTLAQTQLMAIAKKVLADLANQPLESAMVAVFIQQLACLPDADKTRFRQSLAQTEQTAAVRSAYPLAEAERADIQQAVNQCFSGEVQLSFTNSDQSIAGIELSAKGQLIAWSIASYLGALQKNIAATLAAATPASTA
jgi:F-type H+-transporting ATPase subunit b